MAIPIVALSLELDVMAAVDHMPAMLGETTAISFNLTEQIQKVESEAQNIGIVLRELLGEKE